MTRPASPPGRPRGASGDPHPGIAVDPAELDQWEADRLAGIQARAARRRADTLSPRAFAAVRDELRRRYSADGFPVTDLDGDGMYPCPACGHRPDVAPAPLMLHIGQRRVSCSTGCTPLSVVTALAAGQAGDRHATRGRRRRSMRS